MELLDIRNISLNWEINVKDFKALSERAILIISSFDQKFILKKKGSLEQFESELKLLKHLENNKFPTQFPLYNKFGDLIVNYQNANYCIYNYINGETFSATETLQNSMIPKLLGETIATLNKAMVSINLANEFQQKDLYHMVYGYAINEIVKVDCSKKLLKVYQQLEDDIKKVVESLQKQLIHRDSHIHNIVFKDGSLSGVIDFDIAEINVNLFDLCYCSTSVLSEVFSKESLRGNWIKFVGDLVIGYNLYNPLSFSEIKSIWYVMLCIQTIFMSYFVNNKEIYEINKEMFLWIYKNRKNIENTILMSVR
ncbi:phosphotransferase enzyme family protein [Evansella tamaricis]|uniref:Phosphotransferase n=1 Tax=Evansella tamaricis TaxID=2069301 RepID=A0ABS6JKX9_9BACI|nr:phosphotransferase [Evansella tamaricis]MBU9714334.1 phosphotransferase [Evansella tamaricis]